MDCKLNSMFKKRSSFIKMMQIYREGSYPEFPLDMSKKESQQVCRDLALRGVEEMFEAIQHLKNWKPHRSTEIQDFNHDEFLEEVVDAFNYFLSVLVLTGISANDLYDAYCKKDKVIHDRLTTGY